MIPIGMVMPKTVFVDESVFRVDVGVLVLDVVVDATQVSREPVNEVRVLILEICVMEMRVDDRTVGCPLVVDASLLRKASGRSSVLRLIHEETPVLSRVNGSPVVIIIAEIVDEISWMSLCFL